jgi:hypothetical protein
MKMKGITLLCLAMLLSVALAIMPAMRVNAVTPYLEVVFQYTGTNEYIISSCTPPVTGIKVDLKMHDVDDMWGWSTIVSWNPAVLNCTGKLAGPFNPTGTSLLGVINNVAGEIPKLAASTTEEESISGTGVVCTLTFLAHDHGASLINITSSNFIDLATKTKDDVSEVDGNFECQAYVGPPRAPTADFTPITCTQFRLDKITGNVTVDFDASASTGSYDSLPLPGTENPILEYRWDLDGDGVVDYVSTGLVTVALSVTDMQNYFYAGDPYYMGWKCNVTWDPTKYDLLSYEKGPFPAVEGQLLDTESPPGAIKCFVFGTTEVPPVEVTDPRVQGSGIIAYLYFEPLTACYPGEVVVMDSKISTWEYNGVLPVIHKTPYPPEFAAAYTYTAADPHASYTYSAMEATLAVTLTVYAPDCDPSETHLDFVDTDTVTNVIHILPPIMGPDIDVYTTRGGIGKGCDKDTGIEYPPTVEYLADGTPIYKWTAMSDAFGPQEEVTLCAKVTYNEEPVENKMVAFEIWDPYDNVVVYRSAATGEDGIACVSFRIPWQGLDAENMFGAWLITATVDISEHVVMDKCRFRFGYIVDVYYVEHAPDPVHKLGDLAVKVYFINIAFTEQDIFLTIVLYDECGVPIQKFSTALTVDTLGMASPQYTLTIPKWAFVGTGTLYVNVFDAPPYLMGTPMCPENGGMPATHVQIVP